MACSKIPKLLPVSGQAFAVEVSQLWQRPISRSGTLWIRFGLQEESVKCRSNFSIVAHLAKNEIFRSDGDFDFGRSAFSRQLTSEVPHGLDFLSNFEVLHRLWRRLGDVISNVGLVYLCIASE